ncbi:MAG: ABC transporter permease [Actinobacteria bacterium]|nr:ABC transporter permease [Actinomycetota bacterium]
MSTPLAALPRTAWRAARRQTRIDLRTNLLTGAGISYLITPVITIAVMIFLRDSTIMESTISAAQHLLPGMLAFGLVIGGVMGVASELMMEREDGTLLRMKAVPHGLQGFLAGKTLTHLLLNLVSAALIVIPAAIVFPDAAPANPASWLGLLTIFVVAVVVTIPLGALLGAALRGYGQLGVGMLGAYGLSVISGIFYPLAALPAWLQVVGQIFPMYWLGLGFRHAMLPAEAALLELGGTWRTVEMVVVLGIWLVIGVVGAPIALRKMIRGVSGSKVAESRERMLSQGY